MQKLVEVEEANPELAPDFNAKPPRERLELQRKWLDYLVANDYENARILGRHPDQVEAFRAQLDKYERELTEWQRRENARNILGSRPNRPAKPIPPDPEAAMKLHILQAFSTVDDTKLKEAFASGDDKAVDREFTAWVGQLEEIAESNPIFAKWFEEFRDDQEKLLRWDDVIGDEDEE